MSVQCHVNPLLPCRKIVGEVAMSVSMDIAFPNNLAKEYAGEKLDCIHYIFSFFSIVSSYDTSWKYDCYGAEILLDINEI